MIQITAKVSNDFAESLALTAHRMGRTQADIIRVALERYLDEIADIDRALAAIREPTDDEIDWDDARERLLGMYSATSD